MTTGKLPRSRHGAAWHRALALRCGHAPHLDSAGSAKTTTTAPPLPFVSGKKRCALAGTLAERYLSNRKLKLPSYVEDVRFHPSCPFGKERLPCMVALYRDIVSNEPRAIHRTALTPDGHKIDRKALGPKGGCAIKLTPDAEVSTGLTIAEGIETALAGMALNFCPAWALGDAGSIERFPVLSGIECLTILADNDPTGQNAAIECSARWTAEGREVFRVSSVRAGEDIADVWRTRAA